MKFLFAILLCGSCYAQSIDTSKSIMLSKQDIENINIAGTKLQNAANYSFLGIGTTIAGGTISGIGFGTKNEILGYIGIGIAGLGFIFSILPPIYIGQSGNFLIKVGQ